jgi:hypothetical protein
MAIKQKNDEFFVMPLKHLPSVMWALVHENGAKTQKQQVFCNPSKK